MTDELTPTDIRTILANSDADAREWAILQAARKLADAAAHYYDVDDGKVEWDGNAFLAFDDAVREYRALTEEEGAIE